MKLQIIVYILNTFVLEFSKQEVFKDFHNLFALDT